VLFRSVIKKKMFKKFYTSLLEKEGLCFDIGANKGYKSLMLLSLNHNYQTNLKSILKLKRRFER